MLVFRIHIQYSFPFRMGRSADLGTDVRGSSVLVTIQVRIAYIIQNYRVWCSIISTSLCIEGLLMILYRFFFTTCIICLIRNKPLMVIFHLEDCPHSQALKKAFAEDKDIQKLADDDFVILNLVYETTDKHLSPDGQYVPRILFVDPSMTVRADITGRYANRLYAYEPADMKLCKSESCFNATNKLFHDTRLTASCVWLFPQC
uniref:Anterior gradient protein 2 homolog n=1 Tax=Sinocyclocheilus anshuiensis TaxID=1608454 RepID=A0A671TAP7_9TELE